MEPKHLTAGHGWEWIKQGYALFMKAPLLWIVLLLICVVAAVAFSNVPVVGDRVIIKATKGDKKDDKLLFATEIHFSAATRVPVPLQPVPVQ